MTVIVLFEPLQLVSTAASAQIRSQFCACSSSSQFMGHVTAVEGLLTVSWHQARRLADWQWICLFGVLVGWQRGQTLKALRNQIMR